MRLSYGKATTVALVTVLMTGIAPVQAMDEKIIDGTLNLHGKKIIGGRLCLHGKNIGSAGVKKLGLEKNTTITTLNLGHNNIGSKGAKELGLEKNTTITTLNLYYNNIGSEGVKGLRLDENTTIRTLNLRYNNIGDAGIKWLGLDKNKTITTLDLGDNNIGDAGVKSLGLDKNTTITTLDLSGNKIGSAGAKELGLDKNNTITTLNLNYNNIGDAGIKELGLDKNNTITTLNLGHNKIGDAGVEWLGLDKNKTITTMDLYYNNDISNEKCSKLLRLINCYNYSLITLDFRRGLVHDKALLNKVLNRNKNHQKNSFLNFLYYDLNMIYINGPKQEEIEKKRIVTFEDWQSNLWQAATEYKLVKEVENSLSKESGFEWQENSVAIKMIEDLIHYLSKLSLAGNNDEIIEVLNKYLKK